MLTERDYYDVLGVSREAEAEEIKRAFRSLARELHPDVSDDPAAERKFQELAEAYGVLSRSTSRLLYDRFGYRGRGNGWFGQLGPDLSEFLSFTGRRRRGRSVVEIQLHAYEAERGGRKRVRYSTSETCPSCEGEGAAPGGTAVFCPSCEGSGRRKEGAVLPGARLLQVQTCPDCGGTGRLVSDPCRACGASGRVSVERRAYVDVPAGVSDGDKLQLDGDAGFVTVRVRPLARDSRLVRYAATVGLLVAIGFLVLLLGR
jgi:molecular chaperone DnaJ